MHRRPRDLGITAVAAAVLLAAACGSDDTNADAPAAAGSTAAAAATSPATSATAEPSSAPASSGGKLAVVKDAKLGEIVVDDKGLVLYRFDKDTNAPAKSNCSGECLANWPPATTSGKPAVDGVDAALVGTIKRDDGTEQITLGGWPLYRFAADTKAGETKGHGVGGIWWAVTPKGEKVAASEKAASY
jgi:predicted lipoprotein with Yx(FWY)xxD motif